MRICDFHEQKFIIILALIENKVFGNSQIEKQNANRASPKRVIRSSVCKCMCVSKLNCRFLLLVWEDMKRTGLKGEKGRGQPRHGISSFFLTLPFGEGSMDPWIWRQKAVLAFAGSLSAQSHTVKGGRNLALMLKTLSLVLCSLHFSSLIYKSGA